MRLKLGSGYRETRIARLLTIGSVENGGFLVLDSNGERLLESIKLEEEIEENNLSENLKEMILAGKELGIFMDEDENESEIRKNGIVNAAYLHVTNHCNMHCKGCYSNISERNTVQDLSEEELKQILVKLKDAGCERLIISGGEPLLRNDLGRLLKYAKKELKYECITIATNGTANNRKVIEEIVPYVDLISISIDGFSKEDCEYIRDKGSFVLTDAFIDELKSTGVNIRVLPTIHRHNYKKLKEFIKYAETKEVSIAFSLLTCNKTDLELSEYVLSEEEMVELVSEQNEQCLAMIEDAFFDIESLAFHSACGAGRGFISIAADGNVYPCHMIQDNRYKLGNVLESNIEEILNSKTAVDFRKIDVDADIHCSDCSYRYFCGGGCRARKIFQTDQTVDMYCEAYKRNFNRIDNFFESLR